MPKVRAKIDDLIILVNLRCPYCNEEQESVCDNFDSRYEDSCFECGRVFIVDLRNRK